MSTRKTLNVTLTLKSETIFGSGFSVPGGEDISVLQDEKGYPYVPGTVLKGLLRESVTNWLCWCGEEPTGTLGALFGEEDWCGLADERRLQFAPLLLQSKPDDPTDCYDSRVFTAVENGMAKEGSLRIASCVRNGLQFCGEVVCNDEDAKLVADGLKAIKWMGTLRNRGFGRVEFAVTEAECKGKSCEASGEKTQWLRFCIHTESPVAVADLSHSNGNSIKTRGCIPGSTIRGMVIGKLAKETWFEKRKAALLSEKVSFLDALPVSGAFVDPIPSIKGFYEDKTGTMFKSVLNEDISGLPMKRAGVGMFCAPEGGTLHYWSAKTGSRLRINLSLKEKGEDTIMFQTEHLESGQDFVGYVHITDSALTDEIAKTLQGTIWLGGDRYEGFGKCSVTELCHVPAPGWEAYGFSEEKRPGKEFYLLALSPLSMLDGLGEPCGIDLTQLTKMLGVGTVAVESSSTAMSEYSAFNRQWGCRTSCVRMYEAGSVFKLVCSEAPALDRLLAIQRNGLGIRRPEGFGQILFLRPEIVENISGKKSELHRPVKEKAVSQRDAMYTWIMENAGAVYQDGLSKSQVGEIQIRCEQGKDALNAYLEKDLGAERDKRFKKVRRLIDDVLCEEFELEHVKTEKEKMKLLCMLFDYSRKGGK